MKYIYNYITTNIINKKQYIGTHIGKLNDTYLGSGKLILISIKKYGRKNFIKEVLEIHNNYKEAYLKEEIYIKEYNTLTPKGYNISPKGGMHGPHSHSEDTKNKLRKPLSEEHKNKLRKPLSEERKKLISKGTKDGMKKTNKKIGRHLGIIPWNKGLTKYDNPNIGRGGAKKGNIPWNKGKKGCQTAWNKGKKLKKI